MEKMEIKEYLQKMLDRWNKYDELDGFVAENFRVDLEKTLEYWDLRIADNKEELDKAREEGRDSVLFPKFKREKNGTIKQDGWVNTFKFKDEKLNLYIWERVNMMSSNWHSEGGVVIVAKSLERAREIAKEHFNPEEEHSTLTDYDTTVFDTEPNRVFEVSSSEEYYCDFPDAGCC